jgi:hypothetical protein
MADGIARKGEPQDFIDGAKAKKRFAEMMKKGNYVLTMDEGSAKSGNLYMELSHKGRPSRFAKLRPEFWVFEVRDEYWIIVPDTRMREFAERAKACQMVVKGGDRNETVGVLIPVKWIVGKPVPADQISMFAPGLQGEEE